MRRFRKREDVEALAAELGLDIEVERLLRPAMIDEAIRALTALVGTIEVAERPTQKGRLLEAIRVVESLWELTL